MTVEISERDLVEFLLGMKENRADEEPLVWMEREGLSEEAVDALLGMTSNAVAQAIVAGTFESLIGVMHSVIGTSFQIGWEAHRFFRGEREE